MPHFNCGQRALRRPKLWVSRPKNAISRTAIRARSAQKRDRTFPLPSRRKVGARHRAMEEKNEPIVNRKAAEVCLAKIEDFAARALTTEVPTKGERKIVEQSRRALRVSFEDIVTLIIDFSLKEKPKSTDILYQAMSSLMSNSYLLGSITRVSNAARTVTKREQAELARRFAPKPRSAVN